MKDLRTSPGKTEYQIYKSINRHRRRLQRAELSRQEVSSALRVLEESATVTTFTTKERIGMVKYYALPDRKPSIPRLPLVSHRPAPPAKPTASAAPALSSARVAAEQLFGDPTNVSSIATTSQPQPEASPAMAAKGNRLGPIAYNIVKLLQDGKPRVVKDIASAVGCPANRTGKFLYVLKKNNFVRAAAHGTYTKGTRSLEGVELFADKQSKRSKAPAVKMKRGPYKKKKLNGHATDALADLDVMVKEIANALQDALRTQDRLREAVEAIRDQVVTPAQKEKLELLARLVER